jgi:hypothetical protein
MVVTAITFGAATGESDMSRDEIEEFLTDAEEEESLLAVTIGSQITGGVLILAVAAGLYLIVRDRTRLTSLFAPAALVAAGAFSFVNAGANFAMATLATDFAEGGPGGAGDPEVLQAARAIGAIDTFAFVSVIALTGIGVAAFASAFLSRDVTSVAVRPPRWLGWLGLAGGALSVGAWLVLLDEGFFAVSSLGQLLVVVWSLLLGGWLLMKAGQEPEKKTALEPAAG